ncbi:MAG: hypothetical protein V4539_16480 [Bacteroidota bacterium]
MHNPLYIFDREVLDELIKTGHRYFVRQTYKRGLNHSDLKASFLISHYEEQAKAEIHYKALTTDPNRFLYDAENPDHLLKLQVAASQPEGYRIYTLHLAMEEWKVPLILKGNLRRYITKLGWHPTKSGGVNAKLFSQFGELFVALRWQSHETKVPLSDIEKQ